MERTISHVPFKFSKSYCLHLLAEIHVKEQHKSNTEKSEMHFPRVASLILRQIQSNLEFI